jgi:hypothetical protein
VWAESGIAGEAEFEAVFRVNRSLSRYTGQFSSFCGRGSELSICVWRTAAGADVGACRWDDSSAVAPLVVVTLRRLRDGGVSRPDCPVFRRELRRSLVGVKTDFDSRGRVVGPSLVRSITVGRLFHLTISKSSSLSSGSTWYRNQ